MSDGGGSSVYVLLSLVNKETALVLIGQDLDRWSKLNRILGGRKQRQRVARHEAARSDMLNLSR